MAFDAPVGPLDLPIAAASGKLSDPIVEALLPYLAHCLNADLSPKLALLTGTSSTAVPTLNRYAWDPTEPRGHSVKLLVPALFLWWSGESRVVDIGPLLSIRERTLRCMYVFDELPGTDQLDLRTGLLNAADASLVKACARDRHPTYAPGSLAAGTEITRSIGEAHSWAWQYLGSAEVKRFGIDELGGSANVRRKVSGRDYPALAASFRIQERVAPEAQSALEGGSATIGTDGLDLFERELDGADGTELDDPAPP